jgi:hypothetical protein
MVNSEELLRIWLKTHGKQYPLTAEQRDEFKARSVVPQILSFSDASIRRCVTRKRKLEDVLKCLKEFVGDYSTSQVDSDSPPKSSTPKPSVRKAASRQGRSRQTGSVWQAPVNLDEAQRANVTFDWQDRQYP